ncbi:transcriptional regulator [Frankia sp. EI5c]|uniref:MarR family winged helix-turn-helix transcriptional regulator n=1 Tax=Frankia sp. EI5c TaxID=683316 RepID=UPI0007C3E264|nr:MarR family transcriptional regulator [Frankia sp. EI5c]OAA27169.1 transcriptional regulator [Frankia sp. EI5c]
MIRPVAAEAWLALQALLLGGEGYRQLHQACQEVDLPPGALKVLLVLSAGARPMRELVSTFRLDPSYITSTVDALERRGFARREPHPTDRRAKTVAMTDEGGEVVARVRERMAVPPPSFDVLSPAEQEQLLNLLRRILDAEPDIPEMIRPRPTTD